MKRLLTTYLILLLVVEDELATGATLRERHKDDKANLRGEPIGLPLHPLHSMQPDEYKHGMHHDEFEHNSLVTNPHPHHEETILSHTGPFHHHEGHFGPNDEMHADTGHDVWIDSHIGETHRNWHGFGAPWYNHYGQHHLGNNNLEHGGHGLYNHGGYLHGGYGHGDYSHGGYNYGGYLNGGYDHGGYSHGGYDHGSYLHGGYDHGGHLHGGYDHGSYLHGGYDHGGHLHGGYDHGGYLHGGYDHGSYSHGGYDHGGYSHGGYDHGGHLHGGFDHGAFAYSTTDDHRNHAYPTGYGNIIGGHAAGLLAHHHGFDLSALGHSHLTGSHISSGYFSSNHEHTNDQERGHVHEHENVHDHVDVHHIPHADDLHITVEQPIPEVPPPKPVKIVPQVTGVAFLPDDIGTKSGASDSQNSAGQEGFKTKDGTKSVRPVTTSSSK